MDTPHLATEFAVHLHGDFRYDRGNLAGFARVQNGRRYALAWHAEFHATSALYSIIHVFVGATQNAHNHLWIRVPNVLPYAARVDAWY